MKDLTILSGKLLLAVKKEVDYAHYLELITNLTEEDIIKYLSEDKLKNVFWVNIYNAFFQVLRKYEHISQSEIYTTKLLVVAGYHISLDEIEHGILRRFRYKYSLGFLPNLFVSSRIKKWAVDKVDFRIHFALNCGAKSCPPIAFYSLDKFENQLDLSSQLFLKEETLIDAENKTVHISRLFLWFYKDFNGANGIKIVLKKYLKQDFTGFRLKYNDYSWEEKLDNYAESRFD